MARINSSHLLRQTAATAAVAVVVVTVAVVAAAAVDVAVVVVVAAAAAAADVGIAFATPRCRFQLAKAEDQLVVAAAEDGVEPVGRRDLERNCWGR